MTRRLIVVTGTSTGVGKTIATAALATRILADGGDPLVVKPVQTGINVDPHDADVVTRLSRARSETWAELDEPLAPQTAARLAGVQLPSVAQHAERIVALARAADSPSDVIVEGAGGLMVRVDSGDGSFADLIDALAYLIPDGIGLHVVIVCSAGLGTLNHTELTVRELRRRGIEPWGLVVGSWPAEPGLAERCNAEDLPRLTGLPVLATIPEGAGSLDPEAFSAAAPGWFSAQ